MHRKQYRYHINLNLTLQNICSALMCGWSLANTILIDCLVDWLIGVNICLYVCVQSSDAGSYVCMARNSAGRDSKQVQLSVQGLQMSHI